MIFCRYHFHLLQRNIQNQQYNTVINPAIMNFVMNAGKRCFKLVAFCQKVGSMAYTLFDKNGNSKACQSDVVLSFLLVVVPHSYRKRKLSFNHQVLTTFPAGELGRGLTYLLPVIVK